jgi:hypothetical protein
MGIKGGRNKRAQVISDEFCGWRIGMTGGGHYQREREKTEGTGSGGLPGPRATSPYGPNGFPRAPLCLFFSFLFLFPYFLYIFFRFGPNCFKSICKFF